MEVDNAPPCPPPLPNDPAALEGELRAAVTGQQQQQDYGRALAAAEAAELLIQVRRWFARVVWGGERVVAASLPASTLTHPSLRTQTQTGQWPPTAGDAAVVLAAQLLLLLIARDL